MEIVQPGICASGGLTEAKRIATLASVYGVEIVPHTWGTGIAISAALHFVANLDILPGRIRKPRGYVEYDRTENGLRENLVSTKMKVENGEIKICDDPGLGFELSEEALYQYTLNGK